MNGSGADPAQGLLDDLGRLLSRLDAAGAPREAVEGAHDALDRLALDFDVLLRTAAEGGPGSDAWFQAHTLNRQLSAFLEALELPDRDAPPQVEALRRRIAMQRAAHRWVDRLLAGPPGSGTAAPAGKEEDLRQAVRTLAHKVNNPLSALLGRTQLLRRARVEDPQVLKAAEVIEHSARRISELVKDFSDRVRRSS